MLPLFLFVILSMLDLGLAVTRYNSLAYASRELARSTAQHGSLASKILTMCGPQPLSTTAADSSSFVVDIRKFLTAMPPAEVNVNMSWPDNDNSPGDRVQVELSYTHESLVPLLMPWGPLQLESTTTAAVVN